MNVIIVASKDCSHCRGLSKELAELGVVHNVVYAENEASLCQKHSIRHSPSLLVDDKVIFREQVDKVKLREYFQNK